MAERFHTIYQAEEWLIGALKASGIMVYKTREAVPRYAIEDILFVLCDSSSTGLPPIFALNRAIIVELLKCGALANVGKDMPVLVGTMEMCIQVVLAYVSGYPVADEFKERCATLSRKALPKDNSAPKIKKNRGPLGVHWAS